MSYQCHVGLWKDKEEHNQCLFEVLTRLSESGLTLNKENCEFRKDECRVPGTTGGWIRSKT